MGRTQGSENQWRTFIQNTQLSFFSYNFHFIEVKRGKGKLRENAASRQLFFATVDRLTVHGFL